MSLLFYFFISIILNRIQNGLHGTTSFVNETGKVSTQKSTCYVQELLIFMVFSNCLILLGFMDEKGFILHRVYLIVVKMLISIYIFKNFVSIYLPINRHSQNK